MRIRVNGSAREVAEPLTVAGLLEELGLAPERVAVERNRGIVRRADHEHVQLEEGDELEIVTLVPNPALPPTYFSVRHLEAHATGGLPGRYYAGAHHLGGD